MGYTFQQYQDIITETIRITKSTGFIEVLEMDLRIYYDRLSSCSITQLLNTEGIIYFVYFILLCKKKKLIKTKKLLRRSNQNNWILD